MKKWLGLGIVILFLGVFFMIWTPTTVFTARPAVTTQFPNKIREVLPSAVHIMCDQWQGSGVAITPDIIVTARHVVDGVNYTITLNNGCKLKGTQAISHKDYDIGFIKVDNRCVATRDEHDKTDEQLVFKIGHKVLLSPAKLGSIKDCVLGQPIFIVGSPFGKINFNNVTLGIISGLDRDWDELSRNGEPYGWKVAFTSDSGAHPGNSGGPVFSMDGTVIGLLVGGFSPVLNCSMPSDLFLSDIDAIKAMFTFNKYKIEQPKVEYSGRYQYGGK